MLENKPMQLRNGKIQKLTKTQIDFGNEHIVIKKIHEHCDTCYLFFFCETALLKKQGSQE